MANHALRRLKKSQSERLRWCWRSFGPQGESRSRNTWKEGIEFHELSLNPADPLLADPQACHMSTWGRIPEVFGEPCAGDSCPAAGFHSNCRDRLQALSPEVKVLTGLNLSQPSSEENNSISDYYCASLLRGITEDTASREHQAPCRSYHSPAHSLTALI